MLKERIRLLEAEVRGFAGALGHAAPRIVYVSKTVAPERMREAYDAGVRRFGENKVQEFLDKKEQLPDDIEWHLIGHLQTNKIKPLFKACTGAAFPWIHALDRPELAQELAKQADRFGMKPVRCLVQVNISGEASKGGFEPGAVSGFLETLEMRGPLEIRGLMTLAPLTEDKALVKRVFRQTSELLEQLKKQFPALPLAELSMGMSGDYHEAAAEGATLLRIGTAVFGERQAA